jgi:protein ImuA
MGREAAGIAPPARLAELRRYLAGMEGLGKTASVLPFGHAALDAALPWGGIPLAVLHEIEGAAAGSEDGAVASAFLAGILARLAPAKPILWCMQTPDLHPPGLAQAGLAAQRLLLVRTPDERETLWVMEEGLRSRVLAAVVGEVDTLSITASRRLQLAAEASGVTGFVLHRRGGTGLGTASVAVTRWRVTGLPAAPVAGEPGVGQPRWRVALLRCRGGVPAVWDVEAREMEAREGANDVQPVRTAGHVAVPVALADRPALRPRRAAG